MDKGGTIEVDSSKIPPEWIYTDWEGNTVKYTDGFPDFKAAGFVEQEVILEDGFKGRAKDFKEANDISPKTSIDNTWHHHQDGQTLQELKRSIHSRFTHRGGISIVKKGK
ncbi:HNH endonuclease [Streptococcus constellatus]|uniref:HNH endonuclease n=1 Tax=Streptococcus constellatus TaxID=76860 RepID=UPI002102E154|nr:HNH endonuclease [Streptococcus constellatus]UTX65162.1 hypothetical protein DEH83_07870 [Streptococcus constellatus]